MHPFAFPLWPEPRRALGEYSRGGAFCGDEGDPAGVFSYSVSKDKSRLTLTDDAPVCYQRLIEGTWAREK
jgi:hypothetical protein